MTFQLTSAQRVRAVLGDRTSNVYDVHVVLQSPGEQAEPRQSPPNAPQVSEDSTPRAVPCSRLESQDSLAYAHMQPTQASP
jgi:hypothetical protein